MITLFLLAFTALPARAQQGDGKPVAPNPFVEVSIDEKNACVNTGEAKRATAEQLCGDWTHESFPAFRHPSETAILEARLECVNFYRIALRLQNIFCSYGIDAVRFAATSKVEAQKEEVGEQNVSQHAVAGDNRAIAGINKKYMERIAKVTQEFQGAYPSYIKAISKVHAHAGGDMLKEAGCYMRPAATNLDLHSPIPALVRELLSINTYATAYTTYKYVMAFAVENYKKLKNVKEEAEENYHKADMNELGIPAQFEKTMNEGGTGISATNAPTPVEGAAYGAFQDLITRGIKSKFPNLPGPGASIVGGGIVVAWQYYQSKTIPIPETAATFVGMLNPYAGMAANVLVAAYRTSEQNVKNYRDFGKVKLKENGKISAPELVMLWGAAQPQPRQPGAKQVCEESAKLAAQCFVKRAQGMKAYSGDNCAISGADMQEEQQRQQRIAAIKKKLGVQ
jgi:hypothetical protein